MTIVRLTPRERAEVARATAEVFLSDPAKGELLGDDLASALTRQMRKLHQAFQAQDFGEMGRTARALIVLTDSVGLSHEARVAADVLKCADGKDRHALAATLSRLTRLLDGVVSALKLGPAPF